MKFRTRPKWQVLDDLVIKLGTLSRNDPNRWLLSRMIRDLSREIENKPLPQGELFARNWLANPIQKGAVPRSR